MVEVIVNPNIVSLRFTAAERMASMLREIDIPIRCIVDASYAPDGLEAARDLHAPGLLIPGRRKVSASRGRSTRTLVSVHRGVPALVLELAGQRFHRVVVSDPLAELHLDDIEANRPQGRR